MKKSSVTTGVLRRRAGVAFQGVEEEPTGEDKGDDCDERGKQERMVDRPEQSLRWNNRKEEERNDGHNLDDRPGEDI